MEVTTREAVRELLSKGRTLTEIATELGITKSTVCFHKRRLGFFIDERFNRRYDWSEVQRYYDEGHSIRECCRRFGFASQTWGDAVKRGVVVSRPAAAPIEKYLVSGRKVSRHHLKLRLLAAGLKRHECEICGITDWLGEELSMSLHHINGNGLDNRLENLQILCPNCHAQTPNFGSKKRSLAKALRTDADARSRAVGLLPLGPTYRLPMIGTAS